MWQGVCYILGTSTPSAHVSQLVFGRSTRRGSILPRIPHCPRCIIRDLPCITNRYQRNAHLRSSRGVPRRKIRPPPSPLEVQSVEEV